ncbi:MAG TPA: DUF4912 domain-containing protein [Limnochordales bacterium]
MTAAPWETEAHAWVGRPGPGQTGPGPGQTGPGPGDIGLGAGPLAAGSSFAGHGLGDGAAGADVYRQEAQHRPPHGGLAPAGGTDPVRDGPYELPPGYGTDRLTLLVRDPWCVFAFWEVTAASWHDAARRLASDGETPQLVLRLHDLTGAQGADGGTYTDLVVSWRDRWYIHLDRPGRTLIAEIGAGTSWSFVPIARSNVVHTPPGTVSEWAEAGWMSVEAAYRLLSPGAWGGTSPGLFLQREWRAAAAGSGFALAPASPGYWPLRAAPQAALTVDAELILYGRVSDPGANVLVHGQAVPVQPDGSFRFRCSLPDGTAVLPVEARFPDGRRQAVTPVVTRETY